MLEIAGADGRTRTADLLITNHLEQRTGFGGGQLAVKAALPTCDGIRKYLKELARREGFEPPTPRFEEPRKRNK